MEEESRSIYNEILTAVFDYTHSATARGDAVEQLLGAKFEAILGHLFLSVPHRHTAENARKRGQLPRQARMVAVLRRLRWARDITTEELGEWVAKAVLRAVAEDSRPITPDTRDEELAKVVAQVRKHVSRNEIGRAGDLLAGITVLLEGGEETVRPDRMMALDAALRERLQALHPAEPHREATTPRPAGRHAFQPSSKETWEAVRSLSRSTGLGPSGFPVQALKSVATRSADGDSTSLVALTRRLGDIIRGDMLEEIMVAYSSARLLALTKANGKPRPIAVGEILRRLAAKCAVKHSTDSLTELLRPIQRGVGVKGGVEHLVHVTTVLLEAHPEWCVLVVDVKNAFISILR